MQIEWNSDSLDQIKKLFVFDKDTDKVTIYMEDWSPRIDCNFNYVIETIRQNPQIHFDLIPDCPIQITDKPDNLNIEWMASNNQGYFWKAYQQCMHLNPAPDKNIQHTVCTFNGGYTVKRNAMCLLLFYHNLWNVKYCYKIFVANQKSLQFVDKIKNKINPLGASKVKKFLRSTNNLETTSIKNYADRSKIQKKIMDATFINLLVGPSDGNNFVAPYVDEKIILPIINKSIWLMFDTDGWYKNLTKFYGFKTFDNIFDYSFDSINDWQDRAINIVDQLCVLDKLSRNDQQKLYMDSKQIIDYNYDHLVSGKWIQHGQI